MKKIIYMLLGMATLNIIGAEKEKAPETPEKRRSALSQKIADFAVLSQEKGFPKVMQKGLGRAAGGPTGLVVVASTYEDKQKRKELIKQAASMSVPHRSDTKAGLAHSIMQEKKENLRVALVQLKTFKEAKDNQKDDKGLSPRSCDEEIIAMRSFFLESLKEGVQYYVESIRAVHPNAPKQYLYDQAKREFSPLADQYDQKIDLDTMLNDATGCSPLERKKSVTISPRSEQAGNPAHNNDASDTDKLTELQNSLKQLETKTKQ